MIFRPVSPQSPLGPPISKLPVGLTRYLIWLLMRFFGSTGLMICSITASSICLWVRPGWCWVDSTTVSIESGLPSTYLMVTWDLASGRSQDSRPLRRLVAGVAEHEALVSRALLEVQAFAFVHALGNVLRLLAVGHDHSAGVSIEADGRIVVADALDGLAHHFREIDPRAGGDFAGEHHHIVLDQGLGGDSGGFVLG